MRFAHQQIEMTPTVLGLLSVGYALRDFLPCAYIQFVRFNSRELSNPIKNQKEISAPVPELIRILDEVLAANIETALDIASASKGIATPDYPMEALRQITRNAILHRNYEGPHVPVRIYWF